MQHNQTRGRHAPEDVNDLLAAVHRPHAPAAQHHATVSNNPPRAKSSLKVLKWLLVPLLLVSIPGAAYGIYRLSWLIADNVSFGQSLFSDEIKQSAGFTLYFPTDLPEGYALETKSVNKTEEGVVIFKASNALGQGFFVSQQQLQDSTNLEAFYAPMENKQEFKTPRGTATVARFGDTLLASLLVDKTWIIINTTNLTEPQLQAVVKSLKKS